ncbi:MAG: DUF2489 domain-containing protein [Pseudomonadota bacterium]
MTTLLLGTGIIIVIALAAIAWNLQTKVRAMEEKKRRGLQALETQKQEHQQYLNNSIQVLAQGLIDEQLSMTEGAIRISVLMGNLDITDEDKQEFNAFFQLADATAHIPILDAWNRLPKKEKLQFDKERDATEYKFKDFVLDAAQRIKGRRF